MDITSFRQQQREAGLIRAAKLIAELDRSGLSVREFSIVKRITPQWIYFNRRRLIHNTKELETK